MKLQLIELEVLTHYWLETSDWSSIPTYYQCLPVNQSDKVMMSWGNDTLREELNSPCWYNGSFSLICMCFFILELNYSMSSARKHKTE